MIAIDMPATGKNIKRLMNRKGITVKAMMVMLGFNNPSAIYKWFKGDRIPSIDNLVTLADIFGCSVDTILVTERR